MTLTREQFKWLQWLKANGGEGAVIGPQVVATQTGEKSACAAAITFLHLLAKGVVFINGGRICVSDYGARMLKP